MHLIRKFMRWIPVELLLSQGLVPPPPTNVIQAEDGDPLLTEDGQPLLIEQP